MEIRKPGPQQTGKNKMRDRQRETKSGVDRGMTEIKKETRAAR
jgi:hypothetical protein